MSKLITLENNTQNPNNTKNIRGQDTPRFFEDQAHFEAGFTVREFNPDCEYIIQTLGLGFRLKKLYVPRNTAGLDTIVTIANLSTYFDLTRGNGEGGEGGIIVSNSVQQLRFGANSLDGDVTIVGNNIGTDDDWINYQYTITKARLILRSGTIPAGAVLRVVSGNIEYTTITIASEITVTSAPINLPCEITTALIDGSDSNVIFPILHSSVSFSNANYLIILN